MGIEDGQDQQPSQEDLEQFAQENNPEELEQTEAGQAELEAQHEERQFEVAEKAERLQEKIKQKELEIEQVFEELEDLETQLAEKQMKTMGKLLNVFEIRALREKIGAEVLKSGDLQGELAGLKVLYEDFQKEARSRIEINQAERMVSEFYSDQADKLEAREKDKQARDVTNVSREHNAVLTHSFLSTRGPGQVSVMKRGIKWRDMFHATLALDPEISTASTRMEKPAEQYAPDESFFALGILLKGGEIRSANDSDAGTNMQGGERVGGYSSDDAGKDIDSSINKKSSHHNEISVRKPKAAALFFDSDVMSRFTHGGFTEHGNDRIREEIFEEGQRLGMPVYQRDKESGQYFLVTGIKEETIREGFDKVQVRVVQHEEKPANIEDILNNDFELDDEQKEGMRKDILGKELFNDQSQVAVAA